MDGALSSQMRARREKSITGNGHALAMGAAAQGISPGANISFRWGGLLGIKNLKATDESLSDRSALDALAAELQTIHQMITASPCEYLLVGEEERLPDYQAVLSANTAPLSSAHGEPFSYSTGYTQTREFWKTSTQVNFCAKAYPTVSNAHPDAAALTVLGGFLRNGFLHTAIREQGGAYGGGASQDNHNGAFRFYSYRDPRITGTLNDFDASLGWLQNEPHYWQQVEEAILGVVSAIDKPASPAGEAKQTFHAELYGNTREIREQFRQRVLEVTLEDLKRVAATYLTEDKANTAVIAHPDKAGEIGDLNLYTKSL